MVGHLPGSLTIRPTHWDVSSACFFLFARGQALENSMKRLLPSSRWGLVEEGSLLRCYVPDVEQELPETPRNCSSVLLPDDLQHFTHALCYGLNACVPLNSYVEILNPNVMVLAGGAFGR